MVQPKFQFASDVIQFCNAPTAKSEISAGIFGDCDQRW